LPSKYCSFESKNGCGSTSFIATLNIKKSTFKNERIALGIGEKEATNAYKVGF